METCEQTVRQRKEQKKTIIAVLGCPRKANIELLAHSVGEVTSAYSPHSFGAPLSTNMVLLPISELLMVGGRLIWAL